MMTGDAFKKIIITKDAPAPYYNDSGVLIMSIFDFILNPDNLEQQAVKLCEFPNDRGDEKYGKETWALLQGVREIQVKRQPCIKHDKKNSGASAIRNLHFVNVCWQMAASPP